VNTLQERHDREEFFKRAVIDTITLAGLAQQEAPANDARGGLGFLALAGKGETALVLQDQATYKDQFNQAINALRGIFLGES
jgi:hypothetical protein